MPGHGGWQGQEFQSDAFPLRVISGDPEAVEGYGWLYAKESGGVATAWWMDDDGNAAPLSGVAGGFTPVASDPASPVLGDVWYNTTDEMFRGYDLSGVFDFAGATVVNAAKKSGANLGAKVQAAHDAISSGVIDARGITTGLTIASLTITKPVKILWPAGTITITGAVRILRAKDGPEIPSGADSVIWEGCGTRSTIFQKAGSAVAGIYWNAFDVLFADFQFKHTSDDAANVAMQGEPDATDLDNPWVLRPHFRNVILTGSNRTGTGLSLKKCYVGNPSGLHIKDFDIGILHVDDGSAASPNAVMYHNSRVFGNNIGVKFANAGGENTICGLTIEGNRQWGVWASSGVILTMVGCSIEQTLASGASGNVFIEGVSDGFSHVYNFHGCLFTGFTGVGAPQQGKDIVLGAGAFQHVKVFGGVMNSGVNIGAGQPTATIDGCPNYGVNTGRVETHRTTDGAVVWDGNANVALQIQNFLRADFTQRITVTQSSAEEAAVSVSAIDGTVTADPANASAGVFVGSRLFAQTAQGNAENFTGALIGVQAGATHQGDGTADLVEGVSLYLTNAGDGIIQTGVALIVPKAVNAGAGSFGSFTAIQIQETTSADIGGGAVRSLAVDGGLVVLNDGGSDTGNLHVKGEGDTNLFWVRVASEESNVGVGVIPDATSGKFYVYTSPTAVIGTKVGVQIAIESDPGATMAGSVQGIFLTSDVKDGNVHDHASLVGATFSAEHRGTGLVTNIRGVIGQVLASSSGDISAARCFRAAFENTGTADVAEAAGIEFPNPVNSGGGTLGAWYSILIQRPTGASQNYAIFHVGGYSLWNAGQTADSDFVIFGQTDANLFNVDVSQDGIGIGKAPTAGAKLDVGGNVILGAGVSTVGFFGSAGAVKGGAFTQTYATTSFTHIDGSADLVNGTGVSAVDQTLEDVTSAGVADPVKVNRNFAEVVAEYNKLRASLLSTKDVENQVIDILQAFNLVG